MRRLLLFLILLLLVGCQTPSKPEGFVQKPSIGGMRCPEETKLCPDGSRVGRIPPSCDFAPCPTPALEQVVLNTADNVILHATLYPGGEKAVLLLHMLGRDRRSWSAFATALQGVGYTVLAIDLRGHGESLQKENQRIHYNTFTDKDFNDMIQDVKTGRDYLKGKTLSIVGASIGANLALKYAAQDPTVQKIILLSPGLEYRGVHIEQDNLMYAGNLLIVASQDDPYSADSSKKIAEKSRGKPKLQLYEKAGHGTDMLPKQAELIGFLIDWLNQP